MVVEILQFLEKANSGYLRAEIGLQTFKWGLVFTVICHIKCKSYYMDAFHVLQGCIYI